MILKKVQKIPPNNPKIQNVIETLKSIYKRLINTIYLFSIINLEEREQIPEIRICQNLIMKSILQIKLMAINETQSYSNKDYDQILKDLEEEENRDACILALSIQKRLIQQDALSAGAQDLKKLIDN